LVKELLSRLAQKLGVAPPQVTRAAMTRLEAHDWPGNVRELMNVLETALICGEGSLALPEELGRAPSVAEPRFQGAVRAAIEQSLKATRGKIYGSNGAAALLGLKPGTLQSKMKKLGIRRDEFC
jgi:formate hydrogenlyase transcriptional activator